MDWHSRRISAILENALLEDKATSDATSRACIDPQQRATATVLAKQDCILSGVGAVARIFEIYEQLDPNAIGHAEVISHG
jgi:nicotinate-nucleotide pyrophosphorylase (carboxylating)